MSAGIRLDDAVRGLLTEQGSKELSKEDLWALVNASTRLRLTARSLAGLRRHGEPGAATAPGVDPAPRACRLRARRSTRARRPAPACAWPRRAWPGSTRRLPNDEQAGAWHSRAGARRPHGGRRDARHGPGGADRRRRAKKVIAPAHQLPHPHLLWVQENLHHLSAAPRWWSEPALRLAEVRQRPWWR